MVPAFGQHRHVDDHTDHTISVVSQNGLAGLGRQFAMDQCGGNTCGLECLSDILGMIDRRAEDDGLAIACLFFPMADHLACHRLAVHDARNLRHVEIRHGFAH